MQDTAGRDRNGDGPVPVETPRADRIILDLLQYWESLRAGRIAPLRSEIDPRQIKSALGHTFILELDPIGGIRFRLAGVRVCDLLGMELRGMPARALLAVPHRLAFEDILQDMARTPTIVDLQLDGQGAAGHATQARMLLLPMQGDGAKITRILGGISVHNPLFDPPMRFAITGTVKTRIVADASPQAASPQGFSEAACGFTGRPAPKAPVPRGKPHLRLIKNS